MILRAFITSQRARARLKPTPITLSAYQRTLRKNQRNKPSIRHNPGLFEYVGNALILSGDRRENGSYDRAEYTGF
jgi:hypothetical protein